MRFSSYFCICIKMDKMKYAWTIILALLVLFSHQDRRHETDNKNRCVKGKLSRAALFTILSTLLMVGCRGNYMDIKSESLGSNVLALDFTKIDSLYPLAELNQCIFNSANRLII